MVSDMASSLPYVFFVTFLLASALYASVGHGGASAYLAIMGLCEMSPTEMKPIALILNIAVSLLAMINFSHAGHFSFRLFWPLAVASVPAAFLGGWLQVSNGIFRLILALALFFGAWRLIFDAPASHDAVRRAGWPALLMIGGILGFLSGLIGIGGGIFLTPLLLLMRWAPTKSAAAVSAAFIAVNSLSGMGGFLTRGGHLPELAWSLLPFVIVGGWMGSRWGSGLASSTALRRSLAAVLVIAAAKFVIL